MTRDALKRQYESYEYCAFEPAFRSYHFGSNKVDGLETVLEVRTTISYQRGIRLIFGLIPSYSLTNALKDTIDLGDWAWVFEIAQNTVTKG